MAVRTGSTTSSGGTWKTPNPSWGISTPLLKRTVGTWDMGSSRQCVDAVRPRTSQLAGKASGRRTDVLVAAYISPTRGRWGKPIGAETTAATHPARNASAVAASAGKKLSMTSAATVTSNGVPKVATVLKKASSSPDGPRNRSGTTTSPG